jgi:hypothetical protein
VLVTSVSPSQMNSRGAFNSHLFRRHRRCLYREEPLAPDYSKARSWASCLAVWSTVEVRA